MKVKPRILVGCPVCQKPDILKEFLNSLQNINKEEIDIDFLFIDDNVVEESSNLLKSLSFAGAQVDVLERKCKDNYMCNEHTHIWNNNLVWKVAEFKDIIIQHAKSNNYDYLFLIDSDILLQPITIQHLIEQKKDIISEIFWTKWTPESMELPQVWVCDQYTLYEPDLNMSLSSDQINAKVIEFINNLRIPGVYKVGGLGACTLISKNAINKGVSFDRIYNISFWGEDRHFCIRSVALGLELYVDTNYPAYHIYRESELEGANEFKIRCNYKNYN